MICYRDMTFCDYRDCKHWEECHRKLTEKIMKDADHIHIPIAKFAEKPHCFERED